ncbi:hypothetical protein Vi05172_g9944 [Venturia inaequalis]|nr:hypothetical protein Vi05172_g9944 [Venturia inaequalis]
MKVISLSTALLMAATVQAGLRTACVKGPPQRRMPGYCVTYDKDSFQVAVQECRGASPCYNTDNGCIVNKEVWNGVNYANCSV